MGCEQKLPDEVKYGINLTAQTAKQAVEDWKRASDEVIEIVKMPYYEDLADYKKTILEIIRKDVTPENFPQKALALEVAYNKAKSKIDNEIEELRQKLYAAGRNMDATYNLNSAINEYVHREGKFDISTALDLGKQMLDIYKEVKK
jgi:DNA-binding transcriptional regulator GbsR (MarR family)